MATFVGVAAGALAVLVLAVGRLAYANVVAPRRAMAAVRRAGFSEHEVEVDGTRLVYAEGPDNGPPLVLLHAQGVDWRNYAPVLPELAERFHVHAVDYHGHGGSGRAPEKYTAVSVGLNLRTFLDRVVGRPAIVAGHSSGGQLAAWLGANAPELVCGVLLEDPPMFTTLWPRCQRTWNWVDLASTCHFFLESGATDFVLWYVRYGQTWRLFGRLAAPLQRRAREDRVERPMSAVRLWLLPPVLNEMLRGMQRFDPRFGEQFYTGRWNDGFDHEATLAAIQQPSALIHANWRYDRDGILQGAMDDDDAEHARHLLGRAAFHRVRSGHNVHGSRPRHYLAVLDELASAVG